MAINVKFLLSYDPLKWDFIGFKMNIILIRKHIADMIVVNDFTGVRQSVVTRAVIRLLFTTLAI